MHTLVLLVVSTALLVDAYGNASELEQRAREWIDWYMEEAVELHYDWYKAYWQYQTNYTEENMELQVSIIFIDSMTGIPQRISWDCIIGMKSIRLCWSGALLVRISPRFMNYG